MIEDKGLRLVEPHVCYALECFSVLHRNIGKGCTVLYAFFVTFEVGTQESSSELGA